MATVMTEERIQVSGIPGLLRILHFHGSIRPGQHAEAAFRGLLDPTQVETGFALQLEGGVLTVVDLNSPESPFSVLLNQVQVEEENGLFLIHGSGISGSFQLDQKPVDRSYQDVSMEYRDVVRSALKGKGSVICTAGDRAIEKPVIQYGETDWEFAKRLASHVGAPVYPEVTAARAWMRFGLRDSSEQHDFDGARVYRMGLDEKYHAWSQHKACKRADFLYYIMEDYRNLPIGDWAVFHGERFVISEKEWLFEDGELSFRYKLSKPAALGELKYYNSSISGLSLLGTVQATSNETVELLLDIDAGHESQALYPFNWIPEVGNIMYVMPQVGTRVSLYFYSHDEGSAEAINCVRTNGGAASTAMTDPGRRQWVTEHNKAMLLHPQTAGFTSVADGGGDNHQLLMDDESGVYFHSTRAISITATEAVTFEAPVVAMDGAESLMIARAAIAEGTMFAAAESAISINEETDMEGQVTRFCGSEYVEYEPFQDAPQKHPGFMHYAGKFLAGIAGAAWGALIDTAVAFASAAPLILEAGIIGFAVGGPHGFVAGLAIGTGVAGVYAMGVGNYSFNQGVQSVTEMLIEDMKNPFDDSLSAGDYYNYGFGNAVVAGSKGLDLLKYIKYPVDALLQAFNSTQLSTLNMMAALMGFLGSGGGGGGAAMAVAGGGTFTAVLVNGVWVLVPVTALGSMYWSGTLAENSSIMLAQMGDNALSKVSSGDAPKVTEPPKTDNPGSSTQNAMSDKEQAQATDFTKYFGGDYQGQDTFNTPGIDGHWSPNKDGSYIPSSLKQYDGQSPSGITTHASKANRQLQNAGYSNADVVIHAEGVSKEVLYKYLENNPGLYNITREGTVSRIFVKTADGWILIS